MSHVVLGGGISGLSTAFYLSKAGKYGIKVFESANRVGGWIGTLRGKNGTLFELGPRTLQCDGKNSENTLNIIEEVGLTSSITPVLRSNAVAQKRLIYVNNQLVQLPDTFGTIFRIKPPYIRPLMYAFWNDLRTPKKVLDDDSVYNFAARRFGEDYAEYPMSALVCGVFAGDSKEISVKAVMGDFFNHEQKYNSVIRGAMKAAKKKANAKYRKETLEWSAWSFQNGLESFPIHLQKYLSNGKKADIFLEKQCSKIKFEKGKAILTINGEEETTDHVYSSLPSRVLARIISGDSFLQKELSAIPFVSVAVVNLEYDGDLIQNKSFGFLVPPNQNLPILGVIFNSCLFPSEGKTILSVMMGGRWFDKYFGSNPEETLLQQTAEDHVRKILKIEKEPTDSLVTVLRNCLPQYIVGHSRRVENIREYISKKKLPLTLVGNSFDGVGIHDCIMSAKKNVEIETSKITASLVN